MPSIPVRFVYFTGLSRPLFRNAFLMGSWDENGRYANQWSKIPMQSIKGEDGCPAFTTTVQFDASQANYAFRWGVQLDGPGGTNLWGIPTEVNDPQSMDRVRGFTLLSAGALPRTQEERYYLTESRKLGAQKFFSNVANNPALRFSAWAPHATKMDVVFSSWQWGYIDNNGNAANPSQQPPLQLPSPVPLRKATRSGNAKDPMWDGVWESSLTDSPQLRNFAAFDHCPYMFKVARDTDSNDGATYRTDIYSRCQIGAGGIDPSDPAMPKYTGDIADLDGRVSCSVVVDPDTVTKVSKPAEWPADRNNHLFIPETDFWSDEFVQGRPVPSSLDQLVIYELHVASLGYGKTKNGQPDPGTFEDAIKLLDSYLVPLGANAIEVMPVAEFGGKDEWGYGDTHYFSLEFRGGGRDRFKHFVKQCHRLGIAVIVDVVYNHFNANAERAEYLYDSAAPDRNSYYWYEGRPSDYARPDGGYVDNGSTGWAPRFSEETVRKMFVSSAVALVHEFHVDGFRVDLTQALHRDNVRHSDGAPVPSANLFGQKFLREWSRTLKLIRPSTFLIAEDHTKWDKVTQPPDAGGLGFDATWYVDFYHHLVGTPGEGSDWAKLVALVGFGGDASLNMDWFAGALVGAANKKVVYHISHDEAGNSGKDDPDPEKHSHRTIVEAVHGAALIGPTRDYAEARCRFAFGMAMLSPGTPMFLMGEEVGASNDYTYDRYLQNREDLLGMKDGVGQRLFRFYRDLIAFRYNHSALRTRNIDVLHTHNDNRVLVFHRWSDNEEVLIFASLNNKPFGSGYWISSPNLATKTWQEIFNSDSQAYGGQNIGNGGGRITAQQGSIGSVIPASGFVVFRAV